MINERTIINALILIASCALVPFLIFSTLTIDYDPVLLFAGSIFLILAFFYLKDRLCMLPLIGGGITGALNFMPLQLSAANVFCLMLILYYCTGYIAIRQKPVRLGRRSFLIPIVIVTSIVLYHNHALGVKVLGGATQGGRPAILLYVGVLAYFCGINVSCPSANFLKKVPSIIVIVAAVSAIPFFLSSIFPSLAPALYSVTSQVNVQAYIDTQAGGGEDDSIGRFGVFGPLSITIQLYLLGLYPPATWWRPNRWWVLGLSIMCVTLTVLSGFRNVLFSYMLVIVAGAWCHYSWRAFVFPVGISLAVLVALLASEDRILDLHTENLPSIAQRSLSFLPGDWNEDAVQGAVQSNAFRKNIKDVYMKEYFWVSPLFGNGFDINAEEYESLSSSIVKENVSDPEYTQAKIFIVGKMFHTGWLSVYDCVGLVGMAFFIWLGVAEVWVAGKFIIGPTAKRNSPLFPFHIWNFVSILSLLIGYFTVFGDFPGSFLSLCIYGIVLSQLDDLENATDIPEALPIPVGKMDFPALRGYPSRY